MRRATTGPRLVHSPFAAALVVVGQVNGVAMPRIPILAPLMLIRRVGVAEVAGQAPLLFCIVRFAGTKMSENYATTQEVGLTRLAETQTTALTVILRTLNGEQNLFLSCEYSFGH